MSMVEWAENEVKIAAKRERGDKPECEWDYGAACYESALDGYRALMEGNHSGMSWALTFGILQRLCKGLPLTPIEDTEDVWNMVGENYYQCKRMSSLFKDIEGDKVTYSDTNRFICINVESGISYHSGLVSRVMRERYPISMPYYPPLEPYRIFCEDFLVDEKNGDFDTVGIYYLVTPKGEREDINLFFKEGGSLYGCWDAITMKEYLWRKAKRLR